MTDSLAELFARDPLRLTQEDRTRIVARLREARGCAEKDADISAR